MKTNSPRNKGQTQSSQQTDDESGKPDKPKPNRSSASGKRSKFDRNRNGRIDADDILIMVRDVVQWVISWRGAMVLAGVFTVYAASLNVNAWMTVMSSMEGGSAALSGFLIWGVVQLIELLPVLDNLNIEASIGSLVKLQRKPAELPVVNETLNPGFKRRRKRHINREKWQDIMSEGARYVCYGLEIAVLVVGGGILSPTGVSWAGVLMALVGIVGVEGGLRLFSKCAEQLLSPDERAVVRKIMSSVNRTTVKL